MNHVIEFVGAMKPCQDCETDCGVCRRFPRSTEEAFRDATSASPIELPDGTRTSVLRRVRTKWLWRAVYCAAFAAGWALGVKFFVGM